MFISLGAVERSPGFILLLCFRHCDFQRRMGPFEQSVAVYASIDHSDLTDCRLQPASFGGTATLPLAFTKPRPVVRKPSCRPKPHEGSICPSNGRWNPSQQTREKISQLIEVVRCVICTFLPLATSAPAEISSQPKTTIGTSSPAAALSRTRTHTRRLSCTAAINRTISGLAHRRVYKNDKKCSMGDIYVMQRANGDLFALDHHGRTCVPLFHSSRDAMTARSRNGDMLLFKPIVLDARLLLEIAPKASRNDVDFLLVKDPLGSLKRGDQVDHGELALFMGNHT